MNVIGPFSKRDWNTLRLLKKSINRYEEDPKPKYEEAYDVEVSLYKGLRKKYI